MLYWILFLIIVLVLGLFNEVWVYSLLHDKGHEKGFYEHKNLKKLLSVAKDNPNSSLQYYTAFSFKLLFYGSFLTCCIMLLVSN